MNFATTSAEEYFLKENFLNFSRTKNFLIDLEIESFCDQTGYILSSEFVSAPSSNHYQSLTLRVPCRSIVLLRA
jgi:hypothetical protein